ncbi:MAG TPA: PAS domain S-box protein, partial [Deltaproteobacteria bacterium]|nr:PAS domain S-box protein [Deltaproteobacteria bacterium]
MPHKNKNNSRRQNQDIILAFTNQSTGSTTELKNLMAFFDELPFGVFILQKGVFVYANPAFIKIFGCKNESDLLNNPIHDFIHPDDREQLKYTGWNQDASRQKLFRIYSANGQISWVQMAIKSLPCGNNDLSLGYLADLTQTKLRCDYLEQSLDKYQLLFDDVEDVLAEVDLWGNITFVNNSIVKIWGASQEETIGMNYKRYVDKKNERIVRKAYQQIYKSQNPGKITYEIKRIDGRKRFVEDSV